MTLFDDPPDPKPAEAPPPPKAKPAPKPQETYTTVLDWLRCKVRDKNLDLSRNGIRDYVNEADGLELIEIGVAIGWLERPSMSILTHLFDGPFWESDEDQKLWRYIGP